MDPSVWFISSVKDGLPRSLVSSRRSFPELPVFLDLGRWKPSVLESHIPTSGSFVAKAKSADEPSVAAGQKQD